MATRGLILLWLLAVPAVAQQIVVPLPEAFGAKEWREPVANAGALPTCDGDAEGHARLVLDVPEIRVCRSGAWDAVAGGGGGGGTSVVLDLGDDDVDESAGLTEVATVNDPGGVATEPEADKLLLDFAPLTSDAELTTHTGDADAHHVATVDTDDQVASEVPFTPVGGIAATDVQAALEEVDAEHTVNTDDQVAAEVPFTPDDGAEWPDPDPTEVDAALESLVARVVVEEAEDPAADDLSDNQVGDLSDVDETGADAGEALVNDGAGGWSPSAATVCLSTGANCPADDTGTDDQTAVEVPYTPTTGADWTDPDPTEVGGGLDQLADRLTTEEAHDHTLAGDVTGLTGATVVGNDSHDHTGSTISALDAGTDITTGLLAAARGGTGLDSSASTGVARVASGTWSADAGVSHLAASTSADLSGVLSDETGTGVAVFGTAPTIASAVLSTLVNLPSVTAFPGAPSTGDVVIVTDDSAVGACDSAAGSAVTQCRWNGSTWEALGDGGGGGGIGGSTGATDNRILRADGTGGSTLQSSAASVDDSGNITAGISCSDPQMNATNNALQWVCTSHNLRLAATNDIRLQVNGADITNWLASSFTMYRQQVNTPSAQTCTDSGDANPGSLTLTVSATSRIHLTNADPDGCDVTWSETGATDGQVLKVIVVSNAGGTVNFSDTPGVTELAGNFSAGLYDVLIVGYVAGGVDRWVEEGRVNN